MKYFYPHPIHIYLHLHGRVLTSIAHVSFKDRFWNLRIQEQKCVCSSGLYYVCVWERTMLFRIRHGRQHFLKYWTLRHSWTNMTPRVEECNSIGTYFQATPRSKSSEKFIHSWDPRNRVVSEVEAYSCLCSTTLNIRKQAMSKNVSNAPLHHWCFSGPGQERVWYRTSSDNPDIMEQDTEVWRYSTSNVLLSWTSLERRSQVQEGSGDHSNNDGHYSPCFDLRSIMHLRRDVCLVWSEHSKQRSSSSWRNRTIGSWSLSRNWPITKNSLLWETKCEKPNARQQNSKTIAQVSQDAGSQQKLAKVNTLWPNPESKEKKDGHLSAESRHWLEVIQIHN